MFYEVGFKLFADNFTKEYRENDKEHNDAMDFSRSLALEIISRAIFEDNYNVKMYLDRYKLVDGINTLVQCKNKLLNIGILKIYKSMILCGFKPYITLMIKENYLDTVISIYENNPNKRNMISSIVLEIFSIIEK